jgi:hypothetical protein
MLPLGSFGPGAPNGSDAGATGEYRTKGPVVVASPAEARPGIAVRLIGSGFPVGAEVVVGFGRVATGFADLGTSTAGPLGTVGVTIAIPAGTEPGRDYAWTMEIAENPEDRGTSSPFEVLPDPGTERIVTTGMITSEGIGRPTLRDDSNKRFILLGAPPALPPGERVRIGGWLVDSLRPMSGPMLIVDTLEVLEE